MDANADTDEGKKRDAKGYCIRVDRHVARPDNRLFSTPNSLCHDYLRLSEMSFAARSYLVAPISFTNLSNASDVMRCPVPSERRTFTRRRRTPTISDSAMSSASFAPLRRLRRVRSRSHSPVVLPSADDAFSTVRYSVSVSLVLRVWLRLSRPLSEPRFAGRSVSEVGFIGALLFRKLRELIGSRQFAK